MGRCPAAGLFGTKGRAWLAAQDLAPDEQQDLGALLRQPDVHAAELRTVDAEPGRVALERAEVRWLLTIPGWTPPWRWRSSPRSATSVAAPARGGWSATWAWNPRVRQSGGRPAQHGRIAKQGRAHARGMPVGAAWAAAKTPGRCVPATRAPAPGAAWEVAVVATARKLATPCWQLVTTGQDDAFARPSLTGKKLRALELRAGCLPDGARRARRPRVR